MGPSVNRKRQAKLAHTDQRFQGVPSSPGSAPFPPATTARLLTEKLLKRGVHTSVQTLERDLRAWAASWNADPKPFTWTKTAEEILESLQRFCERISGTRH
jgi:hypothetical protein